MWLLLQVSGGDLRKAVTTLQSAVRLGGIKVSRWVHGLLKPVAATHDDEPVG